MCSQLLLMEYLVRLLNVCFKLGDLARAKLEGRSAVKGVMEIFQKQLALYLMQLRGKRRELPELRGHLKSE